MQPIPEIVSFRGRFCEQAENGEKQLRLREKLNWSQTTKQAENITV